MPQTLVLEDVVASAMDTALQGIWTAMPARVESYDAALQRANVQLAVKVASIGEDGERQPTTVAVINAVPVLHAGGGGFREVYPITRGDTVLVVFTARSIDKWLAQGGVVDPNDDHHHDISDAVAIAGLRDFAHPLANAPSDHASIGYDTGATIEFRQADIRIGGDTGFQPTLKATAFLSNLTTLLTNIASAISGITDISGGGVAAGLITTAATNFFAASATFTSTIAKVV